MITKYFNYEPEFNDVFSRDISPGIKNREYVNNLDEKQNKETHWVSLFIDRNTAVYFDSFGYEYISQGILRKIKRKFITCRIFRI